MSLDLSSLLRELSALADSFSQLRDQIRSGEAVNLTGLDKTVEDLCNRVISADPDSRKQLVPKMQGLVAELDLLEQDIRNKQETSLRQQALSAYQES